MRAGERVRRVVGSLLAAWFVVGVLASGAGPALAQEAPESPAPEARGPVFSKDLPKTLADGEVGPQVIDGAETSTIWYPWMAALLDSATSDPFQAQFCGGVLIDPQWVLTAGHCAEGETTSSVHIALGRTNLSSIGIGDRRTISEIHINPAFHYQGPYGDIPADDIALLKLSSPATGIPTLAYDSVGLDTSGRLETVVGWGGINIAPNESYLFPDALHHGAVNVVGAASCESPTYEVGEFSSATMLCVAPPSGRSTDTCPGDSGGPLLAGGPGGYRLVGITSWGYPICGVNPGAYTKVSAFATWIDGKLGDSGAVGTFNPVAPVRILDTRIGTGALMSQPLAPGQSVFPQVTGMGGVPVTGATAVTLNVTVTGPTSGGWLTLYPAGKPLPTASNLNFTAGQTVPNFVTVKLGQGGKVGVNNTGIETGGGTGFDLPGGGAGTVNVVIDLVGWYKNDTAGAYYHPLDPVRIVDTRSPTFDNPTLSSPIGPQQQRYVWVSSGSLPIPINGASAVVLNVTATAPTAPGWLTLFPADLATPPTASNLNFGAGSTIANLVTVQVASQQVKVANTYGYGGAGFVDIVIDLVGYYGPAGDASGAGGRFNAMTPARLVDTRGVLAGSTANPSLNTAIAPQATIAPVVRGVVGIPGTATAIALNATATAPSRQGWFTLFPSWEGDAPTASNLNFLAGQTVPNAAIVKVGNDSKIGISNSYLNALAGTTHAVLDAVGWFEP